MFIERHRGGVNKNSNSLKELKNKFNTIKSHYLGFTLAEVLITLTIIGVVAAMTVPLLTANHKKIEYAAKLKKFYNTMNTALEQAEADYDLSILKWPTENTSTLNYVQTYIAPYVRYTKISDCNDEEDNSHFCSVCQACIYLDDGGVACFEKYSGTKHPTVSFDINGNKGANKFGMDSFEFVIGEDNKAFDAFDGRYTNCDSNGVCVKDPPLDRQNLIKQCQKAAKGNDTTFYGCSGLVKLDGWEFKDDYPLRL